MTARKTGATEQVNTLPHDADRLRPGEVSPERIEWIVEDLEGAALLCVGLADLGERSVIEPAAVNVIGDIVRLAAKKLRQELADAESRK